MNKKQIDFLLKITGKQLFDLKEKIGLKKFSKICKLWLKIREQEIEDILSDF